MARYDEKGRPLPAIRLDQRLFYGRIVKWDVKGGLVKVNKKYGFRVRFIFESGDSKMYEKITFRTKTEAKEAKEQMIARLYQGRFFPYRFSLIQIAEYWLYEIKVKQEDCPYNTFNSYRSLIERYLIKYFPESVKIDKVTRQDLINFMNSLPYYSVFRSACSVIREVFQLAERKEFIRTNPSRAAIERAKKDRGPRPQRKREPIIISAEKLSEFLLKAKEDFSNCYLIFLLGAVAGLRISEAAGVTFDDINISGKSLLVHRQIGRSLQGCEDYRTRTTSLIKTKTPHSVRTVPLPDFAIDEIVAAHARLQILRKQDPGFNPNGFLSWKADGRGYNKTSVYTAFKKLSASCGLPEGMVFHDLRHSYSTNLVENGVPLKSVSNAMGHASAKFTDRVYVSRKRRIPVVDLADALEGIIQDLHIYEPVFPVYDFSEFEYLVPKNDN